MLSDENIKSLNGAINVEAYSKVLMFDPKDILIEDRSEGYIQISYTYEQGHGNLEATTVYIEMPENKIYVMQYFVWLSGSPVWQDGITMPIDFEVEKTEIICSGLFFDKKDTRYTANFPRLFLDEFEFTSMFGTHQALGISGALSFPFGSKKQSGFVLYSFEFLARCNAFLTSANINYMHNEGPSFIPYVMTEDQILSGGNDFTKKLQQHHTTYKTIALKQIEE